MINGRRAVLQAAATVLGGTALSSAAQTFAQSGSGKPYEFSARDLVYHQVNGKPRLARLYQPAGNGPFLAVVQVHGGAWNNKDRTDGHQALLAAMRRDDPR